MAGGRGGKDKISRFLEGISCACGRRYANSHYSQGMGIGGKVVGMRAFQRFTHSGRPGSIVLSGKKRLLRGFFSVFLNGSFTLYFALIDLIDLLSCKSRALNTVDC